MKPPIRKSHSARQGSRKPASPGCGQEQEGQAGAEQQKRIRFGSSDQIWSRKRSLKRVVRNRRYTRARRGTSLRDLSCRIHKGACTARDDVGFVDSQEMAASRQVHPCVQARPRPVQGVAIVEGPGKDAICDWSGKRHVQASGHILKAPRHSAYHPVWPPGLRTTRRDR
jgi:hypothetical protein